MLLKSDGKPLEIDFQTVSFFFVDLLSVLPVDLTCPVEQGHDLGGAFFGCLYFIFHIYDLQTKNWYQQDQTCGTTPNDKEKKKTRKSNGIKSKKQSECRGNAQ